VGLLDIVLGYDCNLACTYCTITAAMRQRALPTDVAVREIDAAARAGWRRVAFTGGEPTIFPSLPALARRARLRGFDEIKVASNGLRYAHAPYLDHLIDAGVNRFHMSMHAFDDAHYEHTVQRSDTATLRLRAIENLLARGFAPIADLIIKTDTLPTLRDWVRSLVTRGISEINLWLVSLTDKTAGAIEQLPRLSDMAPVLKTVFDDARAGGYRVASLHVPRCFLPGYEDHVRHPGADGVRVVTPDEVFDLSGSRLTGGVHPEGCEGCRFRDRCPGLRDDYVAQFGGGEVHAVLGPGGS
jgi:MoaA/NifB/PqqE/SkfB family radical SAM enzyme